MFYICISSQKKPNIWNNPVTFIWYDSSYQFSWLNHSVTNCTTSSTTEDFNDWMFPCWSIQVKFRLWTHLSALGTWLDYFSHFVSILTHLFVVGINLQCCLIVLQTWKTPKTANQSTLVCIRALFIMIRVDLNFFQ